MRWPETLKHGVENLVNTTLDSTDITDISVVELYRNNTMNKEARAANEGDSAISEFRRSERKKSDMGSSFTTNWFVAVDISLLGPPQQTLTVCMGIMLWHRRLTGVQACHCGYARVAIFALGAGCT